MFSYRLPAAAILLAAFVVTACDDDDDDPVQPTATTFNVNLTRANVTPACAAGGANATGTATVTINAQNTTVTVSNLTFTGLSGAATSAHIHSGAAGSAGITTPIFSFAANPTSPATATFTAANYPATAPAGAPANFAAFVTAMKNDQSFIDVHTAACPNGEIRGNLVTP